MYVYKQTERNPALFTVGFYTPDGDWKAESDHSTAEEAAERVHYLNGGENKVSEAEIQDALDFGRTVDQHLR